MIHVLYPALPFALSQKVLPLFRTLHDHWSETPIEHRTIATQYDLIYETAHHEASIYTDRAPYTPDFELSSILLPTTRSQYHCCCFIARTGCQQEGLLRPH